MNKKPGIVVVSCSNTKPKSLIKLITKAADIPENPNKPGVIEYAWSIDTKYYTAEINFIGLQNDFDRTDDFNGCVEALILHMDANKETGLDDLCKWESLENDCNLDVKLLISNYCNNNTRIDKNQAIDWCLKRGYEFIELYPTLNKSDQDEDLREKFGVDRVIEALHSHTWSNLVMKKKSRPKESNQEINKEISSSTIDQKPEESLKYEDTDDFTDLFSQLHMMKDSLQGMPMNQRRQCAEQMVTAFWKAIGGEEEEIFDL